MAASRSQRIQGYAVNIPLEGGRPQFLDDSFGMSHAQTFLRTGANGNQKA